MRRTIMRQAISTFTIVLLLAAWSTAADMIGTRAPDFSLPDQRDRQVALKELAGQVIVLIASDKEGAKQNPGWRKAFGDRYGRRVALLGVADLRKVPFFLKGWYRSDFQKDPDIIILDWKGEVFIAYGFARDLANVVVIDRQGVIRYRHAGAAEETALAEAIRAIDRALE